MSSVLGLPLPLPAPGPASPFPASRAGTREPDSEIGAIRAAAAVTDQQERVAARRGGKPDQRTEQSAEPRDEQTAKGSGGAAAQADYRPAAFAGAFLAQLLSKDESRSASGGVPAALLSGSRQAALGSDAYRRAGGEPPVYSEAPSLFRIAV
jgi:hypothetical protein